MTEDKPINIDDAAFEERVLKGTGVSVVDFWAPWCGPCHSMAPALDAFTKANVGRVKVFKLDVDENPKTAEKYEIKSVPTVIFFKNGVAAEKVLGAMSESALQEKSDAMLS